MISAQELVGEELAEWYSLTPLERWRESEKLWQVYLSLGGSLDPEPDTQSPFFDAEEWSALAADAEAERKRQEQFKRELQRLRRERVRRKHLSHPTRAPRRKSCR